MAIITDLLAVENEIIALLSAITGINEVYRYPAEGVNEDNANTPALVVEFMGPYGGATAAGRNQKIVTVWRIGVMAGRDNYLAVAGVKMVDVMRALLAHKPSEWARPARLMDSREKAVPEFSGKMVFYPMMFEIDIVI